MINRPVHFVKLPSKYRTSHYSDWLFFSAFQLVTGGDFTPEHEYIAKLKEEPLISTRVRVCSETERLFFQLSSKYKLSKIDTFLFIFNHIEKHPKVFFKKTQPQLNNNTYV